MSLLLLACVATTDDTVAPESDTSVATTGTVPLEPCDPAATWTGVVAQSGWVGPEVRLQFDADTGRWSDGCYGGYIEDDLAVTGTTFDWAARIYASAKGPEPRAVRAVGCVSDTAMQLAIVETDGAPFWGPWQLERSATDVEVALCD